MLGPLHTTELEGTKENEKTTISHTLNIHHDNINGEQQQNAADIRYTGLRAALDAVPLTPQNMGIAEIDTYLDQVLALITTPEMDTHDKLKHVMII